MGAGCYDARTHSPNVNPGPDPDGNQDSGLVDPTPHEPSVEICNGFDDNEDGQVDENCVCNPGDTQVCYPLPSYFLGPDVLRRGICRKGTQVCTGPIEFGYWGECNNAVLPQLEVCGDGVDQDCDGSDLPCADAGPPPPDAAEPPDASPPEASPPDAPPVDPPPTYENCDEFTYGEPIAPVDIVWIVDQSGSMGEEIEMVRDNMNNFAQRISGATVDYRVILLARRFSDPDGHEICIPPPLAGRNCADSQRFKQINQHIDSHDALSQYRAAAHRIEGFMRPNSVRHIIVVTDDECQGFLAPCGLSFDSYLRGRSGYEGYTFHSIVGQTSSRCDDNAGGSYSLLSNRTGGVNFDICNSNWSPLYSQLERSVTKPTTRFTLSERPIRGTVVVTFNNAPVSEGTRWRYEQGPNRIVIGNGLPTDGTQISVCYEHY